MFPLVYEPLPSLAAVLLLRRRRLMMLLWRRRARTRRILLPWRRRRLARLALWTALVISALVRLVLVSPVRVLIRRIERPEPVVIAPGCIIVVAFICRWSVVPVRR